MKLMHLADLHLGKTLKDVSFLEDQKHILRQIIALAERENVDAVLISGDVYQRAQPSSEAMTLYSHFLTDISKGRPVYVISGNHDSSERISYLSDLLTPAGIHTSRDFDGKLQSFELEDAYGKIHLHLLPFAHFQQVKQFYPDEDITNSQKALEAVLRHSPIDASERNVLLCHLFITNAEQCESEEQAVGTLDGVASSVLDAFDYVALGHIHKPQTVGRETLRYSGSPLKYSFSEVNHQKSVPIVEMGAKGEVAIRLHELSPIRDMRKLEGYLADFLSMPSSDDYLWIVLHDEVFPLDAQNQLRGVFPNLLRFTIENSKTQKTMELAPLESMENKSPVELFGSFYKKMNGGVPLTEKHLAIFKDILKEVGGIAK